MRVGIVGLGYWGPKLARNFRALDGATVALACDLRQERLDDLQSHYPDIPVTRDYREVLTSAVDAVVVATPVHTHYELAREALLTGKHVLVEKPIASNSAQAEELLGLAARGNLQLMVGHTFLFNPAVLKVRELIQAGELGQIYYLSATRVNLGLLQSDINVMWDLAPHDLSILNYVLNARPVKVSAIGGVYVNRSRDLPEVVYLNLRYENEVLASLRLSWLDPLKIRQLTVVGSRQMLVYDDLRDNKIVLFNRGVEVPPYSVTEAEFRASYRNGPPIPVPVDWIEPLRAECEYFIESIQMRGRGAGMRRSDGTVGLEVLKILECAQKSLVNGGQELAIEY